MSGNGDRPLVRIVP